MRAPAGVKNGYLSVVTKGGGPSALTGRAVYNSLNKPVITKVSPASGPAAGGTTVKIFGTDLAFIRSVHFGTRRGTHLIVVSPREIKIVAPSGHGTVDIRVTTAGGQSALVKADRFKY